MKHENQNWQLTSLEPSRKLKKLGVKQDSLFYWWVDYTKDGYTKKTEIVNKKPRFVKVHTYSAFTVAELGEMLPRFQIFPTKANQCWNFADKVDDKFYLVEATEANARAKMLIYLIENKLITL